MCIEFWLSSDMLSLILGVFSSLSLEGKENTSSGIQLPSLYLFKCIVKWPSVTDSVLFNLQLMFLREKSPLMYFWFDTPL